MNKMNQEQFVATNTSVTETLVDDELVLRVEKNKDMVEVDANSYAKLKDVQLHNGTIQVKMRSRLLPDASPAARGFIGIAFRINENDSEFESFYVRPTNGKGCEDPIRKIHGCQYFSYPGYTFKYFRDFGIAQYEAAVPDIALDEWIALKAVIKDEQAAFYINGSVEPVLVVNDLKHGKGSAGSIGLFVDVGTEGFFKDLVVKLDEV